MQKTYIINYTMEYKLKKKNPCNVSFLREIIILHIL